MAHTVEQILAAARKRRKTKEIDLGEGVKITVREMTEAESNELSDRLWEKGPDGKLIVLDKEGKPSVDGEGFYKSKEGANVSRDRMIAHGIPAAIVDGLLKDDVPESVKRDIFDAINGVGKIDTPAVIAKN